ncbi:hypothetical protein AMS68_003411 [Peltaster fructicola]|uniref:Aminoacyl-transfer RNA synthetases class-II family profile domain-containing protein n=1 Tax=Peltaster fructicola TaxID=286661 RepID=A0A6H0XT35_9PEZI|nr:hypothetical protein AMS68_003411 [Peltaster fructicola]
MQSPLSSRLSTCSINVLAQESKSRIGEQVVLHGYLGTRRDASKSLTFAELHDAQLQGTIQLVASSPKQSSAPSTVLDTIRNLPDHVPIAVTGTVKSRQPPKTALSPSKMIIDVEVAIESILPLNTFSDAIIMQHDTVFSPDQRHLQMRNTSELREALAFRSKATQLIRNELCSKQQFQEIETPLLFKSTPEGAREFLVPTRSPGLAYALPQSPQQYKQILMASAVPRYMQIAKCFRDEDLRADRQPEFTQVDLEMGFATAEDVMETIEKLIVRLWNELLDVEKIAAPFPRMTYNDAMASYGSDKPDLRFDSKITRVENLLPVDLLGKIGPLKNPAVDIFKMELSGDPKDTRKFISTFMDSPESKPFWQNKDGQPGLFVADSRQPLFGLQAFGFEAGEKIQELLELEDGDLIALQAREDAPFHGGSTMLGNLRLALHKAAIAEQLIDKPEGFAFTWINDFPLFSPSNDVDPGQGGTAGLSSTHHPFTSPKTPEDVDLLVREPLKVTADHYDLVVNGVELGGGSRRIHNAAMQEFVMRNILKMTDERIKDFSHLLDVLSAGCPPHAGIALGLDRLIAVMLGRESVRDVIAFPKSGKGEDMLVKSPSPMTASQMSTYHLRRVK